MKVRTYGALMGALLTMSSAEVAESATCPCAPEPAKPAAHKSASSSDNGLSYAQSGYDYRSSSRVTESFIRNAAPPPRVVAPPVVTAPPRMIVPAPMLQQNSWQVAPNDAHIQFYRDIRAVILPSNAPYPQPQSYYPPASYPPAYYSQFSGGQNYSMPTYYSQFSSAQPYYGPPPGYGAPGPQDDGLDVDMKGFNGGVGSEAMGGGGGGGGGGISLYMNQPGGGANEPSNNGGVGIPSGYGPTYRGVWQGPPLPARGGLATSTSTGK